ncbi:MAG: deoxyribodipyrimidine photolyase [Acidimicrobiia bacterium]|nr:deoxyribodipyrimidine photolyase [Acidimicrobiia bacterium]
MNRLPAPPLDRPAVVEWVESHLGGLFAGSPGASPRFVGGQAAADAALAGFDVKGYAAQRNEVLPRGRRGASALSPYIRHGFLTLPRMWDAVAAGPPRDTAKFRDELMWQEYARHLYARIGSASRRPLRFTPSGTSFAEPWPKDMVCVDESVVELESDGWLVNQTRMWLASQWAVRSGADWREGEDWFFTHLLDGSRAANRLGWQWTAGLLTGKPYGFSRYQVEKRSPEMCGRCKHVESCPIQDWPDAEVQAATDVDPRLRSDPEPDSTAGPIGIVTAGTPEAVWVTAESMGDDDPALSAHRELPAVFVFDRDLLARLQLSAKRLVFLAESMADLASRRAVEVWLGDPVDVLSDRPVAVTHTPVPGWRRRSIRIRPIEVHPWPWLRHPHDGPVSSFSAWRKQL